MEEGIKLKWTIQNSHQYRNIFAGGVDITSNPSDIYHLQFFHERLKKPTQITVSEGPEGELHQNTDENEDETLILRENEIGVFLNRDTLLELHRQLSEFLGKEEKTEDAEYNKE